MEYKYFSVPPLIGGKRSDMLIVDDVETPQESYQYGPGIAPSVTVSDISKNLWIKMNEPSKFLDVMKEKDMVIGGDKCHLCGAKKIFESTETYKSKFNDNGSYNKYESYTYSDYECGTTIEVKHMRKKQVESDGTPKVVVGKKCIKVPAE